MGFFGGLFNGIGDILQDAGGSIDDAAHLDFGGVADRVGNSAEVVGKGLSETGKWAGDMVQHGLHETGTWWDKFKNNPFQLAVGAGDPFSTKVWNGILGTDWKPYINQWGGSTQEELDGEDARGMDTHNVRGAQGAAQAIARPILDYNTFGLGGSAVDFADAYAHDQPVGGAIKNGVKNFAINYATDGIANGFGDAAGGAADAAGGVTDLSGPATGGFTSAPSAASSAASSPSLYQQGANALNSYTTPVRDVNLAGSLGVDNAAAQSGINAVAKGAAVGGAKAGLQGNSIAAGAGTGALRSSMNWFGNSAGGMFGGQNDAMPNTGTLGGTLRDDEGENSVTMGGIQGYGGTGPGTGDYTSMSALGSLPGGAYAAPSTASGASGPLGGALSTLTTPDGMWPGITGKNIGNWGQVGTGLYGMYKGNQLAKLGALTDAQKSAQGQLNGLLADPSGLVNTPGYKAGEQAVTRSQAQQGYLGSGNMMAALKDFGGGFYNDSLRTLSGLAAPTAQQQQYNIGGAQLTGNSLQSLLYGMSGFANPGVQQNNPGRQTTQRRGF